MRLLVTTPMGLVVDARDVRQVRAEDATGAFGVRPGHADLLTVLVVSVMSWLDADGSEHHVALRGGMLAVRGGQLVEVATREAVGEDSLERLSGAVLDRFREEAAAEAESRTSTAQLYLAAMRQLQQVLDAGRSASPVGAPPGFSRPKPIRGPTGGDEQP